MSKIDPAKCLSLSGEEYHGVAIIDNADSTMCLITQQFLDAHRHRTNLINGYCQKGIFLYSESTDDIAKEQSSPSFIPRLVFPVTRRKVSSAWLDYLLFKHHL